MDRLKAVCEQVDDLIRRVGDARLAHAFRRASKGIENAAETLRKRYPLKHLAVTLGEKGAILDGVFLPAFPAKAVDSTGAGDSFWGAYLFALLRGLPEPGRFACAAAACCVEKRGAIPAMPDRGAAEARLSALR